MKFKSIPARSWRRSRNTPSSAVSLPQNIGNEECGSESDELNVSRDPLCENGDTDVEIVPDSFEDRNVHPKKQHCFETSDTGKGLESLNLDACIICGITDELVRPCSGSDCPVAFHGKCVNDEPGNEDAAGSYCPYCWFKIQVSRSKALREKAVAAEKALFKFLDKEINGRGKEEAVSKAQEKKAGFPDGEIGSLEQSEDCADIVRGERLYVEKDVCPSREGQERIGKDNGKSRDGCMQLNEDILQSVDQDGHLKEDVNQSRDQCVQLGKGVNRSRDQLVQLNEVIDQSRNQHVRLEKRLNRPIDKHVELEKDQQNKVYVADQDVHDNKKATECQQQVEMNAKKARCGFQASESEERSETEKFQDAEDDKDEETAKSQPKADVGTKKNVDGSPFLSIQESFSRNDSDQVQSNTRRKRRLTLNEFDSDISSNESTNERNGQDDTKQSDGSFETLSSGQATSPMGMGKTRSQQKKSTAAKVAKQKRETSCSTNDKRKRLFWTPEEEAMLQVGVETYSGDANKNIPWRKILEMGAKVFHETRNPTDLKDKWRMMNSKT